MSRALFLGSHPDDVEVSAGGTIVTLVEEGWEVRIWAPTDDWDRSGEAARAAHILGAIYETGHPQWGHRTMVEHFGDDWDLIVTPSSKDSHQEHRAVAELGVSLARSNTISLWEMNHAIPGGIYNMPKLNHFVMFTPEQRDTKIRALWAHQSQVEKYGTWWHNAIGARDRYYGLMANREQLTFAEGFRIVIG